MRIGRRNSHAILCGLVADLVVGLGTLVWLSLWLYSSFSGCRFDISRFAGGKIVVLLFPLRI